MSRHHVMVTHWLDTAAPTNQRTLTVSDDDPAVVHALVRDALAKWMREDTIPMFPELAQDADDLWEDVTDAA